MIESVHQRLLALVTAVEAMVMDARRREGQTVLEWALIAVAISVFVFGAYRLLGDRVNEFITSVVDNNFS